MMLQYSPIPGLFIPVGTEGAAVQAALDIAKARVEEAAWKRGNSQKTPGGPTEVALEELAKIGYKQPVIQGRLVRASYAETKDGSGNTYRKVRVVLEAEPEVIRLSLDIDTELAQGLIQKLQAIAYGTEIVIGAFQVPVNRNGRDFVNHKITVKAGGEEVRVSGFWRIAQDEAAAAAAALTNMGITDKAAINKVKSTKIVDAHVRLLQEVEARLNAEAPAPASNPSDAPAEPAPPVDDDI